KYYRYYTTKTTTPSTTGGIQAYLHYVFEGPAYARLAAAVSNPFTASDSAVAPYADYAFDYDDKMRVADETAAGQGTFSYTYANRSNADGYNSWSHVTQETLPGGSTYTVYTNY